MEPVALDPRRWAEVQFGGAQLKDKRRSKRLVKLAAQVAKQPEASLPQQTKEWKETKAAYLLLAAKAVTFGAVTRPHRERTMQAAQAGRYLVLDDTTELDFGFHRKLQGAAATGNGKGRGFLLHSALVVEAACQAVVGLAAQKIHYRKPAAANESRSQRRSRPRESQIWGEVIDQVGQPPEGATWVHVCDRGADNFEVFLHLKEQKADWVIRVAQRNRLVLDDQGRWWPLAEYGRSLCEAGGYVLNLRSRTQRRGKRGKGMEPAQPARRACLMVSFGKVCLPPPRQPSAYIRQQNPQPLAMWLVRAVEVNSSGKTKPLEWLLLVSEPVEGLEEAMRAIGDYVGRQPIEEWHKALKTGCAVTQRQLKAVERLEPLVGLLSVQAVRLLQLRSLARQAPTDDAAAHVPALWLEALKLACGLAPEAKLTLGEFWRRLAMRGGFLGRRGDGQPGWITLWRGWVELHRLIDAMQLATRLALHPP